MLWAWKMTQSMQTHALIMTEPFVYSSRIVGLNTHSELTKEKDKKYCLNSEPFSYLAIQNHIRMMNTFYLVK